MGEVAQFAEKTHSTTTRTAQRAALIADGKN
jgi:hypothetical protein